MMQILFLLICAVIVLGGTYFAIRTYLAGAEPGAERKSVRRHFEEFFGAETD